MVHRYSCLSARGKVVVLTDSSAGRTITRNVVERLGTSVYASPVPYRSRLGHGGTSDQPQPSIGHDILNTVLIELPAAYLKGSAHIQFTLCYSSCPSSF